MPKITSGYVLTDANKLPDDLTAKELAILIGLTFEISDAAFNKSTQDEQIIILRCCDRVGNAPSNMN